MPTKSEETNPRTVEKSWLGIEASHFSSISLTLIFFPLGAAAVVGAAGFVAVVVVASFFGAVGEVAAGAVASAGFEAGVSSTVADAFSSVVGVVDSAGDADSSCAKVIAARKVVARKEMIIFMGFLLFGFDADYREPGCARSYLAGRAPVRAYREPSPRRKIVGRGLRLELKLENVVVGRSKPPRCCFESGGANFRKANCRCGRT